MSVLEQLTDEQLEAMQAGDMSSLTDEQLEQMAGDGDINVGLTAKGQESSGFGEGIQDFVYGGVAGLSQGYLDDKEFARKSKERSPGLYGTGRALGEAAPLLAVPGSGVRSAALAVGAQSGIQSAIRGEDAGEILENTLEGGLIGAGLGAAGRLAGGVKDFAGEVSNWSGDSLSKAYNISKKVGAPLASKETGLALRGQILSKFDELKNFVATQKKSAAELQKIRLEELSQVADPKVNASIKQLVQTTRDELNKISPSMLGKFAEESQSAAKFLEDIEKGVSTSEAYSLEKINNLKRDLQDYFDFDAIKMPIAGKLGIKMPKKYDFSRIENVMKGFEKNTRKLLYELEKKVPSSTGKTLEDINQEYHNLSKMEKKMPKISEFASNENPATLNNSLQNTIQFHDKLMEMYPDQAPQMLAKQNELLALRDVYTAAEGVAGAPISINRIANVSAYPSALRGAGYFGKLSNQYPTTAKVAKGIGGFVEKMTPPMIKSYGSSITKDADMGLTSAIMPEAQAANEMRMQSVLQDATIGEMQTGGKLPRNYAAARRNQPAIAQALGSIDPETAVRFDNAITNNDARTVENMMSSFAGDPRYNGLFQPTPLISSKGAINSAVISGNRIRVTDPIEQAILRNDFLDDDALSNTERMQKIQQLNKDSSVNLPDQNNAVPMGRPGGQY